MEKFKLVNIGPCKYACMDCGLLDISGEVYRASEVDASLDAKQQEVNNAMELLFTEQRRYDALLADVRALVNAVTLDMAMSQQCKAKECDCTQHKVIKAIAAVEARLK